MKHILFMAALVAIAALCYHGESYQDDQIERLKCELMTADDQIQYYEDMRGTLLRTIEQKDAQIERLCRQVEELTR